MNVEIDKIENSEIEKYILENRANARQFDELEKREHIIKALVTDADFNDVRELFDKILNESWSFCETPNENCSANYCDDNGCQNRKRNLVEPKDQLSGSINPKSEEQEPKAGEFRVGRKQGRAILDDKGYEVALFKEGKEDLCKTVCELLNSQNKNTTKPVNENKFREDFGKWMNPTGYPSDYRYGQAIGSNFNNLPIEMRFVVIQSFASSINVDLYIKPRGSKKSVYLDEGNYHIISEYLDFDTYPEAHKEAVTQFIRWYNENK